MAIKNKQNLKNLKNIEKEISWYRIRKPIADAMRELGKQGFECAGHGCGFGGEHFSLVNDKKDLYVSFRDTGRKCEVFVSTSKTLDDNECPIALFKGTIGKAFKFIKSRKKVLVKKTL